MTEKETKVCNKCHKERPINEFYVNKNTDGRFNTCKHCERERARKKKEETFFDLDDTTRVLDTPGKYTNELQRSATADILIALGWKYCKETQIWWRPGIKDKHGNWDHMKPKTNNIKRIYRI